MEKFLLRTFLAGDELNIIHRQKIRLPVFFLEFRGGAVADGKNQLIRKFLSLDIQKLVVGVVLPDAPADGIDQMGLAQAAAAVQEQGVIAFGGVIGHRPCGGVRQAVAAAHHEGLEGIFLFRDELRLFRGGGGLPDGCERISTLTGKPMVCSKAAVSRALYFSLMISRINSVLHIRRAVLLSMSVSSSLSIQRL